MKKKVSCAIVNIFFATAVAWMIVSFSMLSCHESRENHIIKPKIATSSIAVHTTTHSPCFLGAVVLIRVYAHDRARLTLAHLLQWIKYMQYAGVERFYVYDAYEEPHEKLQYDLLHITNLVYRDWSSKIPYDIVGTQVSAYQDAISSFGHECEWQAALDIDEYPISERDTSPGFVSRYLAQADAKTGEVSLSNYLQVGPANFDERLWLGERYRRMTKNPGNDLVKPIYRPGLVSTAGVHHNQLKSGAHAAHADPREIKMAHVWGARISDFKEEITPELLEMTVESDLLASVIKRVKIWQPSVAATPSIGVLMSVDSKYIDRGSKVVGSGTSYSQSISAAQCWAVSKGYHFFLEVHDLTSTDRRYTATPFASKLMAVKKYLQFVDWILVLDVDCVIANSSKTVESIIASNPFAHVTFHERLHNSEIAAAVWLAKSSSFTTLFIDDWLAILGCVCQREHYLSQNNDNGALIMLLAERLLSPDQHAECKALFDSAFSLDQYLNFARKVHDYIVASTPDSNRQQPISIMRAENGWFRIMELQWHSSGEFGVEVGPHVISMWNRWLGNEFIVHTKNPELLIDRSHALCAKNSIHSPYLKPEWLSALVLSETAKSYAAEVVRFGHSDLVGCFPTCPPLYDAASPPDYAMSTRQPLKYDCEDPCRWLQHNAIY